MREDRYIIPMMESCSDCHFSHVFWPDTVISRPVIHCKHYKVDTMGLRCSQCRKEFPLGGNIVVITRMKAELKGES